MPNYVQLNHGLQRAQGFTGTLLNYHVNQQRTDIMRDSQQLQQQQWDEQQRQQRHKEIGSALKLSEQSVSRGDYKTLQDAVLDNPGLTTQLTHELINPEQVAKISGGGQIVGSKYNPESGKVHYQVQAQDGTVSESKFGLSGNRLFNESRNRFAHQGYGQLEHLEYALRQQGDVAGAEQVAQQKQEYLAQAEAAGMDTAAVTADQTPAADTTRILQDQENEDKARAQQKQTIADKNARLDQMPGGDELVALDKPVPELVEEEEEEEEAEGAPEKSKHKSLKTVLSEVGNEVKDFVLDALPDSPHAAGKSVREKVGEEVDELQDKGALDYVGDNASGVPGYLAKGMGKVADVAGEFADGLVGNPPEGEPAPADTVPLASVTSGDAPVNDHIRQVAYGNSPKQKAPVVRNANLLSTQMARPLPNNPDAWAKRGAMYIASMSALRGGKPSDFDAKIATNIASTGDPLGLAKAQLEVDAFKAMTARTGNGTAATTNSLKIRDQLAQERSTAADNLAATNLSGQEGNKNYSDMVKGLSGEYQHAYNIAARELGIVGIRAGQLPTSYNEIPIVMQVVGEWVDHNRRADRTNASRSNWNPANWFKDPVQRRGLASFLLKRLSALGENGQRAVAKMALDRVAEEHPGMDLKSDEAIELARGYRDEWQRQADEVQEG